jgi:hypothetical protein
MIGIIKWAREKLADTVDNIWCIHCGEKRTVIRHRVEITPNSKRPSMRMIGECTDCSGQTSTFVAH